MSEIYEYDQIVEDLYLTIVNDRGLSDHSKVLLRRMIREKRDVDVNGELWYLIKGGAKEVGILRPNIITAEQMRQVWRRIVSDIMEPTLREMPLVAISEAFLSESGLPEEVRKLGLDIIEHLENANEHFQKLNQILNEVKVMSQLQDTPVKTITYVYGVDVETLEKDQLLAYIKRSKREIADLESAGVESKYVKGQILEIQSAIDLMVEKLDSGIA